MLSWLESTKTLQLYREWRAKRLLLAAAEKALRDEEQQLKARGIVSPVSYDGWQVADARQIAERRYSAFVTHLGAVMTAYWLPVAAVFGLLLTLAAIVAGYWFWAHPVLPKP